MKQLKIIPNFSTYYINTSGEVYSLKNMRFLKPKPVRGYFYVALCKDSKAYRKSVSRLVLETFIGSCPEGMECCHNNGVSTDNKLENLRWDTKKNNAKDAIRHGTHPGLHRSGENNGMTKLTKKDVRMIIYIYRTELFLQKEIAKVYDISRQTIYDIINKRRWKHIWIK